MIWIRRYGAVEGGRFCFEGGTRCGKWVIWYFPHFTSFLLCFDVESLRDPRHLACVQLVVNSNYPWSSLSNTAARILLCNFNFHFLNIFTFTFFLITRGEGLHVFRVDNGEDIQISFDLASKSKLENKKRGGSQGFTSKPSTNSLPRILCCHTTDLNLFLAHLKPVWHWMFFPRCVCPSFLKTPLPTICCCVAQILSFLSWSACPANCFASAVPKKWKAEKSFRPLRTLFVQWC